jgi:hypothetical protein
MVTEAETAVWMEAEVGCTILDAIEDARMDYNRRDSLWRRHPWKTLITLRMANIYYGDFAHLAR